MNSALANHYADAMVADRASIRSIRVLLPPFTLIGATTHPHGLNGALLSRFQLDERLEPYAVEDLARIVQASAGRLGAGIDAEAAREIASRSREVPRQALRILRRAQEVAFDAGTEAIGRPEALRGAKLLRIAEDGLTPIDIEIMSAITRRGRAMGIDAIASTIGVDRQEIERDREPYLLRKGYLIRTRFGRALTRKGRARVAGVYPGSTNTPETTAL